MILSHARALAAARIFRTVDPTRLYQKTEPINGQDAAAEDWEPYPEEPAAVSLRVGDCGCGETR